MKTEGKRKGINGDLSSFYFIRKKGDRYEEEGPKSSPDP